MIFRKSQYGKTESLRLCFDYIIRYILVYKYAKSIYIMQNNILYIYYTKKYVYCI